MVGHMVGMGAQVLVTTSCNLVLGNNLICAPLGVVTHEFLIEPAVNSVVYSYLKDSMLQDESIKKELDYTSIGFNAVGSLIVSQLFEKYIADSFIITGFAGLIGSALFDYIYNKGFEPHNVVLEDGGGNNNILVDVAFNSTDYHEL